MNGDWKDALGSLLQSGALPEGEDKGCVPSPETRECQKTPLHVVMERKGRHGKTATIVEGFECDDEDLQTTARILKQRLGTGGSARGGEILIQGDVAAKVKDILRDLGYKVK